MKTTQDKIDTMLEYVKSIGFGTSKNLRWFEASDLFNGGQIIGGFIRIRGKSSYGDLMIMTLNGEEIVPYRVRAMPKLLYPFDESGAKSYPDEYDFIEVYEKLDGTNILGYRYEVRYDEDDDPQYFVSYKTRGTPTLRDEGSINFYRMWSDMLDKYPGIDSLIRNSDYNVAFELYGSLNMITIKYDVPLATKILLFRDRNTGDIYSPSFVQSMAFVEDVPETASLFRRYERKVDWRSTYTDMENEIESDYLVVKDDEIRGMEGTVWYPLTSDGKIVADWSMGPPLYKCKPPTIKKIHWRTGSKGEAPIGKDSIKTTIINAYEFTNSPTIEDVVGLLQEEFSDDDIEKSMHLIRRVMRQVEAQRYIQEIVVKEFERLYDEGKRLKTHKGEIMRYFASLRRDDGNPVFSGRDMRKVYNVISSLERYLDERGKTVGT